MDAMVLKNSLLELRKLNSNKNVDLLKIVLIRVFVLTFKKNHIAELERHIKYSTKTICQRKPPEAVVQMCSVKKVFLEISQNSQENTYVSVWSATLLKKRLWHRCFPVNFAKFLRTTFFTEHLWRLILNLLK